MKEYTASNGITVKDHQNGQGVAIYNDSVPVLEYISRLMPTHMEALREFFQAEADEKAGRWRYPDDPQYVVYYDKTQDRVTIFNENLMDEDGVCGISRGDTLDYPSLQHVAQAYFAAHPEPGPAWHDAKEGEVWTLGIGGGFHSDTTPVVATEDGLRFLWVRGKGDIGMLPINDRSIDYGTRQFPKAD